MIRGYFTLFSTVGNILFDTDQAFKSQVLHEHEYGFMIDDIASVFKFHMDSTVAVSAFVQLIDLANLSFNGSIFILPGEFFEMIVERAPCHPIMLEKLG